MSINGVPTEVVGAHGGAVVCMVSWFVRTLPPAAVLPGPVRRVEHALGRVPGAALR